MTKTVACFTAVFPLQYFANHSSKPPHHDEMDIAERLRPHSNSPPEPPNLPLQDDRSFPKARNVDIDNMSHDRRWRLPHPRFSRRRNAKVSIHFNANCHWVINQNTSFQKELDFLVKEQAGYSCLDTPTICDLGKRFHPVPQLVTGLPIFERDSRHHPRHPGCKFCKLSGVVSPEPFNVKT
jgi:hypothetical protein